MRIALILIALLLPAMALNTTATDYSLVKQGQLLAEIDPRSYQVQLQLAQLRNVATSRAYATALAENYVGPVDV